MRISLRPVLISGLFIFLVLLASCQTADSGSEGTAALPDSDLPPPPPAVTVLIADHSLANVQAKWTWSPHIAVNQFGYLPDDHKLAVLIDPQQGFNAKAAYDAPDELLLARVRHDDLLDVVGRYPPEPWNEGATDASSGDRGWWVDFSDVQDEGTYVFLDKENKHFAGPFEIGEDVYDGVLRAAVRMYFYQRLSFAKEPQYTEGPWSDERAFDQDKHARWVEAKDDASTERDMHGGWMDAGDYNKYTTFTASALQPLLHAFADNPGVFTDDLNIPESGNGRPDLIDEILFELEWLKRMQDDADGGVSLKVGEINHDGATPPSADERPRYYVGKCSSAAVAAAGMFAHAALVLQRFPELRGEVSELTRRAERALEWYFSNPRETNCDTQEVKSGDADRSLEDQDELAAAAAAYLWMLTGKEEHHAYFREHYTAMRPMKDGRWGLYNGYQGHLLLDYAQHPGADAAIAEAIRERRRETAATADVYQFAEANDLYGAFMNRDSFHWGSLNPRSAHGAALAQLAERDLIPERSEEFRRMAAAHLHYILGVNPFVTVYLTNMGRYGAERSFMQIFHTWFRDGSEWDANPPPGYVPGGPNQDYTGTIRWLAEEPRQKAYHDFNDGWPENSWEVTEPAIYYQAGFINMLSRIMPLR